MFLTHTSTPELSNKVGIKRIHISQIKASEHLTMSVRMYIHKSAINDKTSKIKSHLRYCYIEAYVAAVHIKVNIVYF